MFGRPEVAAEQLDERRPVRPVDVRLVVLTEGDVAVD